MNRIRKNFLSNKGQESNSKEVAETVIKVVNKNGIPFNVRLLKKGENYGLNNCLTHDEEMPLVEFYDGRFFQEPFDAEKGQFVARYYLDTILEMDNQNGLILDYDIDNWRLSKENIDEVQKAFSKVI